MARVCMRPGCDRPAEVRLSYDTVSCQVWLDPILDRPGPVQEICEFHALRLTVPRGWLLCERRVPNPALFVSTNAQPSTPGDSGTEFTQPMSSTTSGQQVSNVPLTIGAPSPRVGRRAALPEPSQIKRRHPQETARELFPDELVEQVEPTVEPTVELSVELSGEPAVDGALDPAARAVEPGATSDQDDEPASEPRNEPAEPVDPDDAKDTLAPTSPLLARAFAQTGPQRSVLSDDLRGPDQKRPKRHD